ncbi:MAG: hypothetical protein KKB02_12705, partial [Alphaproteobacteria bacterium]|nr:hypothetical protein [Alphaproteobacteria bacterium]
MYFDASTQIVPRSPMATLALMHRFNRTVSRCIRSTKSISGSRLLRQVRRMLGFSTRRVSTSSSVRQCTTSADSGCSGARRGIGQQRPCHGIRAQAPSIMTISKY